MFTGHDGPAAMNVYWSVAIITSDQTSGLVVSSLLEVMLTSWKNRKLTNDAATILSLNKA